MYGCVFTSNFEKILHKLKRKNVFLFVILKKKILQVVENPHHYKKLKGELHGFSRVHIDSHFVLLFRIIEEKNVVVFEDFDHHDLVYNSKK